MTHGRRAAPQTLLACHSERLFHYSQLTGKPSSESLQALNTFPEMNALQLIINDH